MSPAEQSKQQPRGWWLGEGWIWAQIVLGCIAAACVLGIINDQITARICLEYFTEGFHKESIKGTTLARFLAKFPDSCTVWGLVWGVVATWWLGAIFGVVLAVSARAGWWPKMSPARVGVLVVFSMASIGISVLLYGLFKRYYEFPLPADQVPKLLVAHRFMIKDYQPAKHEDLGRRYLLCSYIHFQAYQAGIAYGIIAVGWVLYIRYREHKYGGIQLL